MTSLPSDDGCQTVKDGTETLYVCNGVVYRPTYHQDTQVYEIVSPAEEEMAESQSMIGLALTSPMTRGQAVRDLQNLLVELGYDVGTVDGTFGTATESALLWVQYDYELEQTGEVDEPTARALGILPPDPAAESAAEASYKTGVPAAAEDATEATDATDATGAAQNAEASEATDEGAQPSGAAQSSEAVPEAEVEN